MSARAGAGTAAADRAYWRDLAGVAAVVRARFLVQCTAADVAACRTIAGLARHVDELRRRQGKGRRPSSDGAGELGPREPEPPRLRLRLYF